MAKRDYQNDFPSVTQVLGVLRKIGLEMWFKNNTAAYCDEKSKKGKIIGTQTHEAIQSYIETGVAKVETEYDVEVANALKSFMLFRKENPQYQLQKSEIALTSEKYSFNGTVDCCANVEGKLWVADWKSSEAKIKDKPSIYDEYLSQCAAYVYLFNETQKTDIKDAIIVSIAKDKVAYNIRIMNQSEIESYFNEVFLSCLKIYNHQKKESI